MRPRNHSNATKQGAHKGSVYKKVVSQLFYTKYFKKTSGLEMPMSFKSYKCEFRVCIYVCSDSGAYDGYSAEL